MSEKFSRRHLFARLAAGLAALWACLRRPHAAAPAAAVPGRRPHPLPPRSSSTYDGCCRGGPTCVVSTYDAHGRLLSQRVCTSHARPPVIGCSEADGTVTVTDGDDAAGPTPPAATS